MLETLRVVRRHVTISSSKYLTVFKVVLLVSCTAGKKKSEVLSADFIFQYLEINVYVKHVIIMNYIVELEHIFSNVIVYMWKR